MIKWKKNKELISRILQATPAKSQEKAKNFTRKKKRAKDKKQSV